MTHVTPLDDERRLVDAARAGDRRAIERLLRSHQAQLHAVCRRITGNDVDALDATQEARAVRRETLGARWVGPTRVVLTEVPLALLLRPFLRGRCR